MRRTFNQIAKDLSRQYKCQVYYDQGWHLVVDYTGGTNYFATRKELIARLAKTSKGTYPTAVQEGINV